MFVHGSGSSRRSPRNRFVADRLYDAGLATLLFDLLTESEAGDRVNVFDIELLASRVTETIGWIRDQPTLRDRPIGLFGASTGAAARTAVGRDVIVQVEVDTLDQLDEVLQTDADRILLDNMDTNTLTEAVGRVDGAMVTEASGGVNLDTVRGIAETGVDIISVGWLTHSAPNFDVALDFVD